MAATSEEHSRFAVIFAGGTMISRVLGLARDLLWSTLIPGASFDAFIVALRLPNMLRDLFGEGATNAAFVPVFSETIENEGDEAFRDLVSAAMSAMLVFLGILTVVGIFLLPSLLSALDFMHIFTQRDPVPPERIELMTTLALWTFPYLFLIGMAIFMSGPLYAVKHYLTPSWTPALLNVALISTCL